MSSSSTTMNDLLDSAVIIEGNKIQKGNSSSLSLLGRSKSLVGTESGFHYPTSRNFPETSLNSSNSNLNKELPTLNGSDMAGGNNSVVESTNTSDSSHLSFPTTPLQSGLPPTLTVSTPIITPRTAAKNEYEIQLEQERTAGLIFNLYQRLDEQGVEGDGWDEGRERSRDGIIHRNSSILPNPSHFNSIAQLNGNLPPREEQILKRVDRSVLLHSLCCR